MGVPSWLLKLVMAFLTNRRLLVRFLGENSSIKPLPGGGPQGTLLGLLLFLVLINDIGFDGQNNNTGELLVSRNKFEELNRIHLKYVDDLTVAEAIKLEEKLVQKSADEIIQPLNYHERTGQHLPPESSEVQKELLEIEQYAEANEMQLNIKKTHVMLFNPCKTKDFMPQIEMGGQKFEVKEQTKLLGLTIQ